MGVGKRGRKFSPLTDGREGFVSFYILVISYLVFFVQ